MTVVILTFIFLVLTLVLTFRLGHLFLNIHLVILNSFFNLK